MAARVGWNPAGGSKALPDGAVHQGRGTRQLHDVTGKVQHARLIVAVQRCAMCELPRWTRILNFLNELIWKGKASLAFG